jgi:hypothetical protein
MSTDPFIGMWNTLQSDFSSQESREKVEDVAVMLSSIAVAEAVPVLGEIQMGLQFLDFIDPYGYNQALTREQITNILTNQYQQIQDAQTAMADCYTSGDTTSCAKAKVKAADLQAFQALPASVQAKRIKSLSSWATPFPPEVNYPDMYLCKLATSPERMEKCQNQEYKALYQDYFQKHQSEYQANAQAAEAAAIAQMSQGLTGGGDDQTGTLNRVKGLSLIGLVIAVVIIYRLLKKVLKE